VRCEGLCGVSLDSAIRLADYSVLYHNIWLLVSLRLLIELFRMGCGKNENRCQLSSGGTKNLM
jgi:hypothetical protein